MHNITDELFALCNKNISLVDIGANIGSVALPLAGLFNKSNIIAIEPTIYAFKKLKKNISLNSNLKKRIKTFNFFIYSLK